MPTSPFAHDHNLDSLACTCKALSRAGCLLCMLGVMPSLSAKSSLLPDSFARPLLLPTSYASVLVAVRPLRSTRRANADKNRLLRACWLTTLARSEKPMSASPCFTCASSRRSQLLSLPLLPVRYRRILRSADPKNCLEP